MQDLTLVGVHDDGEHLVLAGADGQRFRVRVDESLRAAVRRDRARLGQLQIENDGRLRPRDIQARIRAGQTAEEIAESSGLPVEHVRRYEGPVLAEREFVVRQARAVRIRRAGGTPGGSPTLGDLVTERLAAREVAETDGTWDAWRAEDGAWIVSLSFTAGSRERRAQWAYDAQLRHVSAQDDEARWLTDDEPAAAPSGPQRRLTPVRPHDRVYDVEADGGVRPVEAATGTGARHDNPGPAYPTASQPLPATAGSPKTGAGEDRSRSASVDLLDTLRERRGRRQRPTSPDGEGLDPFETAAPSVWMVDQHPDPDQNSQSRNPDDVTLDLNVNPETDLYVDLEADLQADLEADVGADLGAGPDLDAAVLVDTDVDSAAPERVAVPVPAPPPKPGPKPGPKPKPAAPAVPARRSKRASVPSWDDIVFGGRRE